MVWWRAVELALEGELPQELRVHLHSWFELREDLDLEVAVSSDHLRDVREEAIVRIELRLGERAVLEVEVDQLPEMGLGQRIGLCLFDGGVILVL